MLRVQTSSKAHFPGNPLPGLWIKSQRAAQRVTCLGGQGGGKHCTHGNSPESGSAVAQNEVTPPLTGYLGLLPLLWPGMLANQQGRKMCWATTRCRGFFPLAFFLALASRIHSGLRKLALVVFFPNKNPIVEMNGSVLLPFLPGSSLNPQKRLEQKEREELFQIQVAAGLTTPFTPTAVFARPFPEYFSCLPTLPLPPNNTVNLF